MHVCEPSKNSLVHLLHSAYQFFTVKNHVIEVLNKLYVLTEEVESDSKTILSEPRRKALKLLISDLPNFADDIMEN